MHEGRRGGGKEGWMGGGGGDGGFVWRLHVLVCVRGMSHMYHVQSTILMKAATCMHAKQLIDTGVAAFA